MSLRMQIYNELVNKHSGIRERYMEVHCKQTPFSKINSYFVLLWLNVRYYILKDWTLDYIKIVRENEQKNLKTDVPESLLLRNIQLHIFCRQLRTMTLYHSIFLIL